MTDLMQLATLSRLARARVLPPEPYNKSPLQAPNVLRLIDTNPSARATDVDEYTPKALRIKRFPNC